MVTGSRLTDSGEISTLISTPTSDIADIFRLSVP
jgi:hypothetical protein